MTSVTPDDRPLDAGPLDRLWGRLGDDGRLVAHVWIFTRLLLIATGLAVAVKTGTHPNTVFARWDVEHFVAIANNGYAVRTDVAFFPGLPLLLRAGAALGLPMILGGVLLSLVTSALAVWALYRLGGRWASIGWLLAPTAVFTLVPYSESPFCAAAFWSWERASKGKWGPAAALAAVACTFRVSGLFLIGALGVLALVSAWRVLHSDADRAAPDAAGVPLMGRREGDWALGLTPGQVLARSLPWLLLPLAVLGAYVVYLYTLTGSWTAWFSAQSTGWMRGFHWPWQALANHWAAIQPGMYADHPGWVEIFRAELVAWLIGLALAVWLLVRRKVAASSWVAVQVLAFSLSYWLQSVTRAVLLWFPLWTELGAFVENHRHGAWRVVWGVVVAVALVIEVVWGVLFYKMMWAS